MNLIISSWPGAGGSTIAMIMALELNLKYIYAGGVLKAWAKKMGYDPSSDSFHEWENLYGKQWDFFWEDYILEKFKSESQLLCEGKTAGFLLPEGKAFEIMVTARAEIRTQRAGIDGRTESITARDEFLQKRWLNLFNIDLFDINKIKQNYDLLIDNSELTIFESLKVIFSKLKYQIDSEKLQEIEKIYWEKGKNHFRDKLDDKGLIYTAEDIFSDWNENYQTKLNKLPTKMYQAITG